MGVGLIHGDHWYCADSHVGFQGPLVYDVIENVQTVYVVTMGDDFQDAKFAFNSSPTNYLFSYEASLLSKLVWFVDNNYNFSYEQVQDILWALNSNLEFTGQDITRENFVDSIQKTTRYRELVFEVGEDILNQLLMDVISDDREYEPLKFATLADHTFNRFETSQTLFSPGQAKHDPTYPEEPEASKTSITVSKHWVGGKESSVFISLLADGKILERIKLDDSNLWTHTFNNLDLMDSSGKPIVYTVVEDEVFDYDVTISGDASKGFIITNTKKPSVLKDPNPSTPNPVLPNTGISDPYPMGLLLVFSGYILILLKKFIYKQNNLSK